MPRSTDGRPAPWRGLALKTTLVFVAFATVLLSALGGFAAMSGSRALEDGARSELAAAAMEKEAAVNDFVDDASSIVKRLVISPRFVAAVAALVSPPLPADDRTHTRLVEALRRWQGRDLALDELFVMDAATGRIVAASDPREEGKFKEDRPYFLEGRLGLHVEDPYYSFTLDRPVMYVSAPVREGRRLLGVLAGRLNLAELNDVITRSPGIRKTDDAYLVDRAGFFVTQPRFVKDPAVLGGGVRTTAVRRCLAGESGTTSAPDYRGVPAIVVYRWLRDRKQCLVVKVDEAEALAPSHALRRTILAGGAVALLGASAVAVGLALTITRPVRAIQAAATRVGRGELDVRVRESSGDELGLLAREFNTMAGRLAQSQAELRRHADELQRANQELEAFSYSVSHDLRAPLRAISGFSRILLDKHDQLSSDAQRQLRLVDENARHMDRLIDDLLAFSRLSRQPLEKRRIDLGEVARAALADLQAEQEGRRVLVTIGELPRCQADPSLLKQVFMNLLANALKFTVGREVARIEVGARQEDPDIAYFVKDNGVGFDMRYADTLFQVFQRLHRAEDYPGTGVGLAIVRRVVERHGGRVWAQGEPDKGATISFTLGEAVAP